MDLLKQRLIEIERKQNDIEKRVMDGADSPVGVHCFFIEWSKLQVEYFSLYNLLESEGRREVRT